MRLIKNFGISNKGYKRISQLIEDGLAEEKDIIEEDVNSDELEMGIEVELEHTENEDMAKEIALDHLAEIPDYYTRLKKMEEEALEELNKDSDEEVSEEVEEEEDED